MSHKLQEATSRWRLQLQQGAVVSLSGTGTWFSSSSQWKLPWLWYPFRFFLLKTAGTGMTTKRSCMWSCRVQEAQSGQEMGWNCHSPHMTHGQNTDGFTDHHRPRAAINGWLQLLRQFILQRTHMSVRNCQQQHPTTWHGYRDLQPGHLDFEYIGPPAAS